MNKKNLTEIIRGFCNLVKYMVTPLLVVRQPTLIGPLKYSGVLAPDRLAGTTKLLWLSILEWSSSFIVPWSSSMVEGLVGGGRGTGGWLGGGRGQRNRSYLETHRS